MLFQACFTILVVLVRSVTSDPKSNKRCGWLFGNTCFPQPHCIDKNLCSSPPFKPVCGTALPPCNTNAASIGVATTKPLPTLPPLTTTAKQPYHGYNMGSPLTYLPRPPKQGNGTTPRPMNRLPRIVNAPVSSIVLKEKEQLKLICSVDNANDPSTRIEWVRESDNVVVGRGETFLLKHVDQNDAGKYYCKVQNSGNILAAMAQTDVKVECSPKISRGGNHTVVAADPGENVTLICETKCKPEPNYIWYRDNIQSPLKTCEPAARVERPNGRGSTCNLTTVVGKRGETFTCLKVNSLGKEKQIFEIMPRSVIPKPVPTGKPSRIVAAAPHILDNGGKFNAVGCFVKCDDCASNFPELLFVDTGQTQHYGDSLRNYNKQFVYRCAKESQSRGFEYFGITSYDQCYSGDQKVKTYDRFGKSNTCITGELKPCTPKDNLCVGQCSSFYVYKFYSSHESSKGANGKKRTLRKKSLFKPSHKIPGNKCSPLKQFLESTIITSNENG